MADSHPPLKHKTVGISMHPHLETRGKARAEALGLRWSAYVCLCVEAELKGMAQIMRDDSLDLEQALERARHYQEKKTLSIDFEMDIEQILQSRHMPFERFARVGPYRCDFLVQREPPHLPIALECRYNIQSNYAVALGQSVLLRSLPDLGGVCLVVPYLETFDPAIRRQFESQQIHITTPDRLVEALHNPEL